MAASRRCLLSCLAQTYVYGTRASKEIDVNTRSLVLLAALVVLPWILTAAPPQQITGGPLPWAYGADVPPPLPGGTQPDDSLKHVPGSNLSFTRAQISNAFGPADWHPEDHGPMPDIVAYGRRPQINACALCHYANGKGRAENAGVSGLPVTYFIQQMMDFKNGVRDSAEPRKANTKRMIGFAKAMTDEEIRASAEYYGSIMWTPWIKVVEATRVPKTRIAGGLFLKLDGNETEPLANRIIEVPDDTNSAEILRDDHVGFTAYVPVGSIKKGEALVTTGGAGKTVACGTCHGTDLEGLGPVPPLAGRSPSYIARQIYDMQHGARNGLWTPLMRKAIKNLNEEEIIAICAYVSSRPVPAAANATSVQAR